MRRTPAGRKKCADMKKTLNIILMLAAAILTFAEDGELNRLTDIVKSLRSGGEKAYQTAIVQLAADKAWTPMNELGFNRAIECKVSERVPGFRLNAVLTNAENAQRYQTTTGNHLNGADSRYNYSLFEKTLKAGKTAEFSLAGRWGEQVFVIMPYQGEKASLDVSVSSDGNEFTATPVGNGAVRMNGNAVKGKDVKIRITNTSAYNISYVILNFNSRK